MPSKQVTQDIARAQDLLSAATVHQTTLTEALETAAQKAHVRAYEPKSLLALCTGILKHHMKTTLDADIALDKERSDDAKPLRTRDAAAEALAKSLSETRDSIIAACGEDSLDTVGLRDRRPASNSTDALIAYAQTAVAQTENATLKPTNKRIKLDLSGLHEDLALALEALLKAQTLVDKETRELQDAMRVRDAEWTDLSNDIRSVGLILEGLLRLASLHELADRLRAASRSPSKKDEAPEPTPAPK